MKLNKLNILKQSKRSKQLIYLILYVGIVGVIVVAGYALFQYLFRANKQCESFQNKSDVSYYWIVSEKRKPMMLNQIQQRNLNIPNSITTNHIQFVPGIFSNDTKESLFADLPAEWLSFPVVRLLGAHMNALYMFKTQQDALNQKTGVMVCMEDDIALRNNYEEIEREAAKFINQSNNTIPIRISLGYVDVPKNITFYKNLTPSIKLSKLNVTHGDPYGTQCYMMNYAYVDKTIQRYKAAYSSSSPDATRNASDIFLFDIPDAQHYVVEEPAAIEDNPTFGSMLGHSWNSDMYKNMIAKYDRNQYFKFN